MATRIPQRELSNHTTEVLRRVEQGERVEITVNGHPVAELGPLDPRPTFVPTDRLVHAFRSLLAPDDALAQELLRSRHASARSVRVTRRILDTSVVLA